MTGEVGSLVAGLVVGAVGTGFLLYGKQQRDPAAFVAGIALCGSGYLIDSALGQYATGAAICLAFWIAKRRGLI